MRKWLAVAVIAALAACAAPPPPPPPPVPPPPPPPPPARPLPPQGASANFVPPPRALDGAYVTPNNKLDADETTFHLRAALNVAALSCTSPPPETVVDATSDLAGGPGPLGGTVEPPSINPAVPVPVTGALAAPPIDLAESYNAFLKHNKKVLAAANKAIDAHFKAQYGKDGLRVRDSHMTALYNYFAMPAMKSVFCPKARHHLETVADLPPEQLPAYAAGALADIEGDFQTFFADFDAWRQAAAAWDTQYGSRYAPAAAALPPAPNGN